MTPEITFSGGLPAIISSANEHPELARADLPQSIHAITNFQFCANLALERGNIAVATLAESEAQRITEKTFPPAILERLNSDHPPTIRVLGVVVGQTAIKKRIYYAWVTEDQPYWRKSAEGLAHTISKMPAEDVIEFLDAYLGWLGNCEYIGEGGQVELETRYLNKSVRINVAAKKTPSQIHLMVTADRTLKNRKGIMIESQNPLYWLRRARVGLFNRVTQKARKQEGRFMADAEEFWEQIPVPIQQQLHLTLCRSSSNTGLTIQVEMNDYINGQETFYPLNPPSTGQLCNLLARLTHPRDFEPNIAEQLSQEQIDRHIAAFKDFL